MHELNATNKIIIISGDLDLVYIDLDYAGKTFLI
jgi:hypothetical protein